MFPESSAWDDWPGAEAYREYVESYPLYAALNRRLAELAELEAARRVLDLGCGTGVTTLACLERLPASGRVLAVDASPPMIEIARARVRDARARFERLESGDLAGGLGGRRDATPGGRAKFDRVVSNAAFWLFPNPRRLLGQVRSLLADDGLLVFNVPAERLETGGGAPDPLQRELWATLQDERAARPRPSLPLFEPEAIEAAVEAAGLRLERTESFVHVGPQRELIELMKIPAMSARLAPWLSRHDRLRAVDRAAERCDPDLVVEIPWVYFVARPLSAPGTPPGPPAGPPAARSRGG